jgi:hypothetical protein
MKKPIARKRQNSAHKDTSRRSPKILQKASRRSDRTKPPNPQHSKTNNFARGVVLADRRDECLHFVPMIATA